MTSTNCTSAFQGGPIALVLPGKQVSAAAVPTRLAGRGAKRRGRARRRAGGMVGALCGVVLGATGARAAIEAVASFPVNYTDQGCIQIDARLIGYSAGSAITTGNLGGGDFPNVVQDLTGDGSQGGFTLGFNENNDSGGGVLGVVFGGPSGQASATTTTMNQGTTYGSILGNQQQVDGWHTYDLVWNRAGLITADAANGHQCAVYIDGHLVTFVFVDNFSDLAITRGPGVLDIGNPAGQGDDPRNIAFDNLRMWSTANQAPASLVLANNFDNQQLVSSVGPNGTYLAGDFIGSTPGNGTALSTVPEAGTECAALAGLFLAGVLTLRRGRGPAA